MHSATINPQYWEFPWRWMRETDSAQQAVLEGQPFHHILNGILDDPRKFKTQPWGREVIQVYARAGWTKFDQLKFIEWTLGIHRLGLAEWLADKGVLDPPICDKNRQIFHQILITACRVSCTKIIEICLEKLMDPDTFSVQDGMNLIHLATKAKNEEGLSLLLEAGADQRVLTKNGRSCLHIACAKSNINIVKILVEAGADPFLKDAQGASPLQKSMISSDSDIFYYMWEKVRNISEKQTEAVIEESLPSAAAKNFEIAKLILKSYPNIDVNFCHRSNGRNSLIYAALKDADVEEIQFYIERGADVNTRDCEGFTPLHYCAQNNAIEACKLLIQAGCNPWIPDETGRIPLYFAAERDEAFFKSLLDVMPNSFTPPDEYTMISPYVGVTTESKIRLLHQKYPELIRWRDSFGYTVLQSCASASSAKRAVATLAELGAELDYQEPEKGWTALHMSIGMHSSCIFARGLLEAGADVHVKTFDGITPIHLSALNRMLLFSDLLKRGADPNIEDRNGWTFLHHYIDAESSSTWTYAESDFEKHGIYLSKVDVRNKGTHILALNGGYVQRCHKLLQMNWPINGSDHKNSLYAFGNLSLVKHYQLAEY